MQYAHQSSCLRCDCEREREREREEGGGRDSKGSATSESGALLEIKTPSWTRVLQFTLTRDQHGCNDAAHQVPALLEPNGNVFEARLSFGPKGLPAIMGLTFSTPNNTAADYKPTVQWAATLATLTGGGGASSNCTSSSPRVCYTASPVVHVCNMTALLPSTQYFYRFGSAGSKYGFTKPYSFKTPAAPGPTTSGAAKVSAIVYGDMGLDYSKGAHRIIRP